MVAKDALQMTEPELPSLFTDTPRRWTVAGKLQAASESPAAPRPKPPVTDGLALFESAAPAEDGYAQWKAAVADEKAAQAEARKAEELPEQGGEDGFARWKADMDTARRAFEHRWGVPLGKRVRLQLRGEPREREGLLRALEEQGSSTLRLSLDGHVFAMTQIESVSRL
ncbi:MAG: hypothetical protein RIS79_2306 [Verrucomicrobiota bacterium]|jgi:hypothetical protein